MSIKTYSCKTNNTTKNVSNEQQVGAVEIEHKKWP